MPQTEKMNRTRALLTLLDEDRLDYESASRILMANEPSYSLEEVKAELRTKARTRHRKPRKID
jgi:hypothetical protein